MRIQGRVLLLGSLTIALGVSFTLFAILREKTAGRFAMEVYNQSTIPEKKPKVRLGFVDLQDKLPFSPFESLVVRIEGKSAGHTKMKAMAFLLSDQGEILGSGRPLIPQEIIANQQKMIVEEAIFPPLGMVYRNKNLMMVVVRFPEDQLAQFAQLPEKTKLFSNPGQVLSSRKAKERLEERVARIKFFALAFSGHTETRDLPIQMPPFPTQTK